jgi:hypothetical protein
MLARSSVKAILLCSCAILLLPNFAHVVSSEAGDMTQRASLQPVVPGLDAAAMAVMPEVINTVANVAPSAPIMPSTAPQARTANVAPGENPFGPTTAPATPMALTVPTPVPQVQAATAAAVFKGMSPAAAVTMPAPSAAVAGKNPFMPATSPVSTVSNTEASTGSAAPKVDDTALRYYASTRDLKRLGAELRRLKALYPDWEAPENLFDQTATVQEQPLWDMYAAGNYTGVRAELARLQSTNPQWKPSADLTTKLAVAESRKVIDRAYSQANWPQIITTAQQQPDLLVCNEMNAMWQVGEALARIRDFAHSFELYKYILTHCDGGPERLATIQKASLLLPEAGTTSLFAFGRAMPDGTAEFASIAFDGIRKTMGQIASGEELTQRLSDTDLQSFASYVQSTQSASDSGLFGWYYYSQKQWQASNAWFTIGTHYGNDAKNFEGIVLSLRNMGKTGDAYTIAAQYAGKSDDLRKEYIEIVAGALTAEKSDLKLSDKEMETFHAAVFDAKSALGAQALGWKALADGGAKDAAPLFAQSLEWDPTQGGVIGAAVVAARNKDYVKLAALKSEYGKTYDDLDQFKIYSGKAKAGRKAVRVPIIREKKPKSLLAALFS